MNLKFKIEMSETETNNQQQEFDDIAIGAGGPSSVQSLYDFNHDEEIHLENKAPKTEKKDEYHKPSDKRQKRRRFF